MCLCVCSREDAARVLAGALQAPPAQGLVFQVCILLHQLQVHMWATLLRLATHCKIGQILLNEPCTLLISCHLPTLHA